MIYMKTVNFFFLKCRSHKNLFNNFMELIFFLLLFFFIFRLRSFHFFSFIQQSPFPSSLLVVCIFILFHFVSLIVLVRIENFQNRFGCLCMARLFSFVFSSAAFHGSSSMIFFFFFFRFRHSLSIH